MNRRGPWGATRPGDRSGVDAAGRGTDGSSDGAGTRPRPSAPSETSGDRRGQTTLDFTFGIAVFILAVIFVVSFIPAMFQPFAGGSQSNTVVADRLATQLTTGMLTESDTPFTLSMACTADFFNGSDVSAGPCSFDDTKPLHGRLGLESRQPVNVSVTGDVDRDGIRSVLCRTAADELAEAGHASCADQLALGETPAGGSVTVARRAVTINGETAMLEVRLWR